jgi:hypothetical protein
MVKDEPSLIISDYYDFHEKSSFSGNSFILCGSLEGDPLFFKEYFSTLSGVIAIGGMMRAAGAEA